MKHRHPFVLGSGKTQKKTGNFRSGDLGKRRRTRVIFILGCTETQRMWTVLFLCWGFVRHRHPFVLGSGKTQKNTDHFCSGDLGKSRRTWVIFVLGGTDRRKVDGSYFCVGVL